MHPTDLAEALATITGQRWRYQPITSDTHFWLICDDDRACLNVREDRGRLEISGSFWEHNTNLISYVYSVAHTPYHTIGASASRSPLAVARDIARRLLPAFRADLAEARTRYAERLAQAQRSAQLAADLAALVGGSVRRPTQGDDGRSTFSAYNLDYNIRLDGYTYGDDVTVELRGLTPEQAARVLQSLI